MKVFPGEQTRQEYLATQIARSGSKFTYCKVSAHDVRKYRVLLERDCSIRRADLQGPVACLGTRNGREVDLFRLQWFSTFLLSKVSLAFEQRTHGFTSRLRIAEAIGRSDVRRLETKSVVGVEINPRAARRDIWVGSFDDMPAEWAAAFAVVYWNSFDQSQDPRRTALEWKRVIRPGGFLIFCYANEQEPNIHDRVGRLSLRDVPELFGGRLVYFHDRGSRNTYTEIILQF